MKRGLSLGTHIYGTSAEFYTSRLFHLARNPKGSCRPDLLSNGNYQPKITIEVKSSGKDRSIIYDGQHYYALNLADDYETNCNEIIPRVKRKSAMPMEPVPIAYYYASVARSDNTSPDQLDRPYSSIRFDFNEVKVVPAAFVFYYFAIQRALAENRTTKDVVKELKKRMAHDYKHGAEDYRSSRKDSRAFKGLYGSDILALFHNDPSLTSTNTRSRRLSGQQRIDALRRAYPQVDDLRRIHIQGPNATSIYILAEDDHQELFDTQMRREVSAQTPALEQVILERRSARRLLNKINPQQIDGHFTDHGPRAEHVARAQGLSRASIHKLERLVQFLAPNELPYTPTYNALPIPTDDIPI